MTGRAFVLAPAMAAIDVSASALPVVAGRETAGQTGQVEVLYDAELGERGLRLAAAVLERVDRDMAVLCSIFGGALSEGSSVQVVLARLPEHTRAFHLDGDRVLYADVCTVPRPNPWYSSFLVSALLADLFAVDTGRGWDPATHTGEALSRVLAASLYPHQLTGFATAPSWLDETRADFVNSTIHSEREPQATGCAALFLNYLHYQLGFSWPDIVGAGGGTLAEAHERLTDQGPNPFDEFRDLLGRHFPSDRECGLDHDNPFPLAGEEPEREPLYRFELVGPGIWEPRPARPVASVGPAAVRETPTPGPATRLDDPARPAAGSDGMETRLDAILANRRWMWCTTPFPHVRARRVFVDDVYLKMEAQFHRMWADELFARDIPGYDVDATAITLLNADAFSPFVSRAWLNMLAGLFQVRATDDLNVALHHHRVGSASGRPHNDFNPGWFADGERIDGINVHDPATCDYKSGKAADGVHTYDGVRAVAVLFYLANDEYKPWHGGTTGLYRSNSDPVNAPVVAVPPVNNSLVAFECTPWSFHSFITNPYVPRNSLVMWLHQTEDEADRRWGRHNIVRW